MIAMTTSSSINVKPDRIGRCIPNDPPAIAQDRRSITIIRNIILAAAACNRASAPPFSGARALPGAIRTSNARRQARTRVLVLTLRVVRPPKLVGRDLNCAGLTPWQLPWPGSPS